MFVKNEEYDDGKVYIAVKNEIYNVYPPVGHTVVFSFDADPRYTFGPVTMYMQDGDGRIIAEKSDDPAAWTYRTMLTDQNFSYRPAPLSETGGVSTRLYAEQVKDGSIFVQWDAGVVAAGPNAPWCRSIYTIYRLDGNEGI